MIKFLIRNLIEDMNNNSTGEQVTYEIIQSKTGISPNTLSKMAQGKMSKIGIETIDRLCYFFDCSPGDLIIHERRQE